MENYKKSNWVKWENRSKIENMKYPGIYSIAVTYKILKVGNLK